MGYIIYKTSQLRECFGGGWLEYLIGSLLNDYVKSQSGLYY